MPKKKIKKFKAKKIKRTRRDDIEIDPSKRVPSGIPGFDDLIEGGFEVNSINLIAGGAGSGKSIIATQFLYNGAVKYDEPGIYISFEEDKNRFFTHMKQFGWDLEKLEEEKKFIYVESTPEQVKKILDEGGGTIDNLIDKFKAKRLVIDSISAFTLLFDNELAKREASLALFKLIRKWRCTAFVIGEFPGTLLDQKEESTAALEYEVDSIIVLYYGKTGDIRKRAIEVLKMRGTRHARKIFPMKIYNKGIEVFPKEAVF